MNPTYTVMAKARPSVSATHPVWLPSDSRLAPEGEARGRPFPVLGEGPGLGLGQIGSILNIPSYVKSIQVALDQIQMGFPQFEHI